MSKAWKASESQWPKTLKEFKVGAVRISRAGDYSQSIDDVRILGADWLKNDCKYRKSGFLSSTLLKDTEDLYCKEPGDTQIVITKGYRQVGQDCVVHDRFMAMLLSYWLGCATKEELWEIYLKK